MTGSGTVGTLPVWNTLTTQLSDSLLRISGSDVIVAGNLIPDANASRTNGSSTVNWNAVHTREVDSDAALFLRGASSFGGGILGNDGTDFLRWGIQSASGNGVEFAQKVGFIATNAAGSTALAIANAPSATTPQWIPVLFNGTAMAILAVPI